MPYIEISKTNHSDVYLSVGKDFKISDFRFLYDATSWKPTWSTFFNPPPTPENCVTKTGLFDGENASGSIMYRVSNTSLLDLMNEFEKQGYKVTDLRSRLLTKKQDVYEEKLAIVLHKPLVD